MKIKSKIGEPSGVMPVAAMCQLTGHSEFSLRDLAKSGHFPKAKRGQYQIVATLAGLMKYHRARSEKEPTFDSLAQLASAAHIPKSVLRKLKRAGCPAFVGGRIKLYALLEFFFEQGADDSRPDLEVAKAMSEHWRAKLLRQKWAKEDNQTVSVETHDRALRATLLPVRQMLEALPTVVAHRVNPSDPIAARKVLESYLDEQRQILSNPPSLATRVSDYKRDATDTVIIDKEQEKKQND